MQTFSFPLLRSLRQLEWITILLIVIADLCHRFVSQGMVGSEIWSTAPQFVISLLVLSCILFRDFSKLRQSQCFIWLSMQIILVTIASITGTCGPLYFFSLLITAKSVLVLGKKTAAFAILLNLAAIGVSLGVSMKIFERHGLQLIVGTADIGLQLVLFAICNVIILYIARAIVREVETRTRVEQLARANEVLTAELERSRIARDLHDTLGHTLISLGLQLELIEEFRSIDPERTNKALKTARQLNDDLINEVRRTVQAIRDPSFDLNKSMQALIQQVRSNDKIQINLDIDVKVLPNRIGYEVLFIARECLTNAQKHAGASNIQVKVQQTNTHVELNVKDNGKGFQPSVAASGYGLKNMKERVNMLSGHLDLNSSPGNGTQISVSIPL
jgi:signal transduction histidine kinase